MVCKVACLNMCKLRLWYLFNNLLDWGILFSLIRYRHPDIRGDHPENRAINPDIRPSYPDMRTAARGPRRSSSRRCRTGCRFPRHLTAWIGSPLCIGEGLEKTNSILTTIFYDNVSTKKLWRIYFQLEHE